MERGESLERTEQTDGTAKTFFQPTNLLEHGRSENPVSTFREMLRTPRQRHNFRDLRDISRAPVNHRQSFTRFHGIRNVKRIPSANFFVSLSLFLSSVAQHFRPPFSMTTLAARHLANHVGPRPTRIPLTNRE